MSTELEQIYYDSLTLDVQSEHAYCINSDLALSPKEFALLFLFVQEKGKSITGDYIYEKIWNRPTANNSDQNALTTALSGLHKKLELFGFEICYKRNSGYALKQLKSDI